MSDLHFHRLESLWRTYQVQLKSNPELSVDQFAERHLEFTDDIKTLFPLMKDLSVYAKDPLGHPQAIGDYDIQRQIGIGGMGVVYEAICPLRDRVAIKVVEVSTLRSIVVKRLKKEAKVTASLHHENIVPIFDYGEFEDKHYYAMRLIDGPNLSEVLQHDYRNEDELSKNERRVVEIANELAENWSLQIELIQQAASAIAYSHSQGVLHRDIKPANMLIDSDLKLWVTDFGLARHRSDDQRLTTRSRVMGTPRYMAPEQIRGESDERSDIFGLGLTLYEMVLLRKLGENRRRAIWKGGLRDPREFNPSIPELLSQTIMKAVNPDPQQRHECVEEFLEELDDIQGALADGILSIHDQSAEASNSVVSPPVASLYDHQLKKKASFGSRLAVVGLITAILASFGYIASKSWPNQASSNDSSETTNPSYSEESVAQTQALSVNNLIASDAEVPSPEESLASGSESTERTFTATSDTETVRAPSRKAPSNQPPSLAKSMFSMGANTIVLSTEDTEYPIALECTDDQDSPYDGLFVSISGGRDHRRFAMTPQGILAFLQPVTRKSGSPFDSVYEIEIAVADCSRPAILQVQKGLDGNLAWVQVEFSNSSQLSEVVLAKNVLMPPGLIDIATADGDKFFHLHRDKSGTTALFVSSVGQDGELMTRHLNDDCGISQNTIGLATCDGVHFMTLQPDSSDPTVLIMRRSVLSEEGKFQPKSVLKESTFRKRVPSLTVSALSSFTDNQSLIITRSPNEIEQMSFAFPSRSGLVTMPLSNDPKPFEGSVLGQASWVRQRPTSITTIREIELRVQ